MENISKITKFKSPKLKRPFYQHKRVPRKFKKKWKHILQGNRYDFLNLNQKLWFILSITNKEYHTFLINETIKK